MEQILAFFSSLLLPFSLGIVVVAMYAIYRGLDVRMVLFAAGLVLVTMVGKPLAVFDVFFSTMGDGKIIGPICSAMGFAFVLRATGCDREMVRMLIAPIRHVRWLLVPGGCIVGFITNMAITSQTAAAAAVGPILIPLMLGARYHPIAAAATLVLGCSAGGNLFNPGEPDVVNIQLNTNAPTATVINTIALPELAGFAVAIVLMMYLLQRLKPEQESINIVEEEQGKINILKALLPPLPIAMLFVLMPQFNLVPWLKAIYPEGIPVPHAMIFSTMIAMLITRKELSALTKQFFEGLGYGYVHVISLIITAACFIEGLKLVGLTNKLVSLIAGDTVVGNTMSMFSTMFLAVISGSGTAPSVTFSKTVLPHLVQQMGLAQAVDAGALGAIGATFGRTMSPVAAIVIFASSLSNVQPVQVVKQTSIPLLVAALVALVLMTVI